VDSGPPSFESWVDFCFCLSEHHWSIAEEHQKFLLMQPPVLADYLQRLFLNSSTLLSGYSFKQLGAGVWFIFGVASEYMYELRASTPPGTQVKVTLAVKQLYSDLFDVLGDTRQSRPARHTNDFNELDNAVYMIWDMGQIECGTSEPHLVDPTFELLEHVILCKTVACQISGLHGLNHQHHMFPVRVEALVDLFLEKQTSAMPWVREYAVHAKRGNCL
jgi:hypothetical protein